MGNSLSSIFNRLWNLSQDVRVTMVGLDAAGKTTVLYKLKLDETVSTIPTIGFNVETVQYKNVNFTVWDVGGQARIRPLWRHYFQGADAVIFVVDSADKGRIDEAREELQSMMEEVELADAALLVMANKQDLSYAMNVADMVEGLGLRTMKKQRPWYIQGCVATKGEGLCEGMDWLATQLSHKKRTGSWKY